MEWNCSDLLRYLVFSVISDDRDDCLSAGIPVFISVGETMYFTNNSNVTVTMIGPANHSSLNCHTDSTTCCRDVDDGIPSSIMGNGKWLFPNGTSIVRKRVTGSGFYYTRFHQVLRLYRQGDIHAPLGRYCCRISDSGGEMRTFCANLVGE